MKKLQASRKSARIQKRESLDIPNIADSEGEPENEEEDESRVINGSESEQEEDEIDDDDSDREYTGDMFKGKDKV